MNFNWKDMTNFDRMITPIILKVLFWLGVIISVIAGIFVFFGGIISGVINGDFGQILGALFGGPLTIVIGILVTRIYAELLIVIFQINESLTDIKQLLKKDE